MFDGDLETATVSLAREPDFRIGALDVCPSACRVAAPGRPPARVEPRIMEVLVVLARRAGRTVTRDELIDICWGGRVVSDDAVSRVVAEVRRLARDLEPAPFVLETVPKVGFRLATAEPLCSLTPPPAPPASPLRRARGPLAIFAMVLALAALTGGAVALAERSAPPQDGRVAVGGFRVPDRDPTLTGASTQLSDSLVQTLTGVGVGAETRHGGSRAELLVDGALSRNGGGYVADTRILDRRSGAVLWSGRFEQPTAHGLAAATATSMAGYLECAISDRRAERRPMETEAFGLYLTACANMLSAPSVRKVLAASRRLVAAAPQSAGAQMMLAMAAAFTPQESIATPEEAAALGVEARAAAAAARRLDPQSPQTYMAMALAEPQSGAWEARERDLQHALARDPDQTIARLMYATLLRSVGRTREAIEYGRNTHEVDDPRAAWDCLPAQWLAATGDVAGGLAALARLEANIPGSTRAPRWMIALWWEDPARGLEALRTMTDDRLDADGIDCFDRYLRQRQQGVRARGLPASCDNIQPDWRVRMLAREGDLDGAFAEAARPQAMIAPKILFYTEMAGFRADRRFMPLAARLGLAQYWRRTNRWPDFCRDPSLPYDCRAAAAAALQPARTA